MKKTILSIVAAVLLIPAIAQESGSKFNVNADLVSRYVWRGAQFSNAPAIQPTLSYTSGGFSAGAWGSYALNNTGSECDLYATYSAPFGLSVTGTAYFFPQDPTSSVPAGYFDEDNHTFELGLSYTIKGLSLSVYKYLNQNEDFYTEISYKKDNVMVFAGAGDQLYSASSKFNLVNVGVKVSKEVSISDKFTIKPFGSFIINPNQEQVFLVVGLTL
jgi:uncharacterized protein (TIGR02001 family)